MKYKLFHSVLLSKVQKTAQEGTKNLVGFFEFWRQYIHLGIPLTRQPITLSALRGVQTKKTSCSRSRLWFKLPCYLGFMTQQIVWYLKCPLQIEMLYRLWLFPIQ